MREGLVFMVSPGAWRILCRVGWLRRVEGDEWELVNCRSVIRTGGYDSDGLQKLAQCRGEIKNHTLGLISKIAEPIHRLQMIRPLPIPREDWESWEAHCPKPKDWEEK